MALIFIAHMPPPMGIKSAGYYFSNRLTGSAGSPGSQTTVEILENVFIGFVTQWL